MFLKRIRIYGFKSFAQDVTIELEPGITALVGPNGGGKSNVVDAIRWALGEQRLRDLRAERWDDLLHHGGSGRPAARLAEVSLEFDNHDGEMSLWPESLVVSRRYYKSGDSEYLVNGHSVRLKDLTDLFLDSGVGRFNYAIISQGRVEDALLQKPLERLEQLEEAAGVSRYKVRKKETLAHLRETEAKLVRLGDLLQEVDRQMEAVRERADIEARYRALETSREDWQTRLHYTEYRRALEKQHRLSLKVKEVRHERVDLQAALDAMAQEILDLEEALRTQGALVQDEVAQLAELREQETHLTVQMTEREGQRGRVVREREVLTEALQAIAQRELQLTEELGRDDRDDADTEELEIQAAQAQAHWRAAQTSWERAQAEKDQCEEQLTALSRERSRLNQRLARIQGVLRMSAGVDEVVATLRTRQTESEELQREVERLGQEVERLGNERIHRKQSAATAEREIDGLRQTLASHQARLRALQQLEAEGEGLNAGVRAVLRGQREARLQGVLGTLGSLVEVPEHLALAVETALGGAHQDVVMHSEKDARAAVQFLKAGSLGRATFLPLDTVRPGRVPPQDEDHLAQEVGVVGWAAELIDCAPAIRPAVQHVLGRVLIVEGLDEASRLGALHHFRYKMVTLDGQIVHAGGAITGGSRIPSRGGASTRKMEIADLTRKVRDESAVLTAREALLRSRRQEAESVEQELQTVRELLADQRHRWQELRQALDTFHDGESPDTLAAELQALEGFEEKARRQKWEVTRLEAAARQELEEKTARRQVLEGELSASRQRFREHELIADRIRSEITRLRNERQVHQERLAGLAIEERTLSTQLREMQEELMRIRALTVEHDQQHLTRTHDLKEQSERLSALKSRQRLWESEDRKMELKIQAFQQEMREMEVRFERYQPPMHLQPLSRSQEDEARAELARITASLVEMGPVAAGSLALFQQLRERHSFLDQERQDVNEAQAELLQTLQDIDEEMDRRVKETANKVEQAFAQACRHLYGGGEGGFTWSEKDAGVDLWVRPSGKRPSHLGLLSGGEKALGGIAWLFSLLSVRPSPFVVLDEVEASLDEANAVRFAQYIRMQRQTTQYVIVTHQRETMEAADALWGVAGDGHGQSRLVSVRLSEPEERGIGS